MVATTHRQGNNKEHVLAQLDQFITILHYTKVHPMLIGKMAQGVFHKVLKLLVIKC